MKIISTPLPGVIVIEPRVFGDSRGFFMETYQAKRYEDAGIKESFVQDNASRSRKGVLRGLHYQLKHPQGKLVSVSRGEIFDVAVDIRVGSPTFGQHYSQILSEENHLQMYIPPGFAHGFCVMSDVADFSYKCTDYYDVASERSLTWNDPQLEIVWPLTEVTLSEKDKNSVCLGDMPDVDLPKYR